VAPAERLLSLEEVDAALRKAAARAEGT
jgi:hypothetical protein